MFTAPLLADAVAWLTDHAILLVGAAVVLVGLFLVGKTDVPRFSWQRVWAISGVCFAESVRRRVLWIIPLAILGLVAVVQLQQPTDEQDAIRQTTKFCLYASGLVVVLTTLILACTNLPREIENRVIFTVVTKPTTRLEIVLGKVVGFARVSFTILLIMGLFTWGYLHLRAGLLTKDLAFRLEHNQVEPISRPAFQHYVDQGLLNAKTLADPATMNIYGRPPAAGSHRRYLNGEGYVLAPFALPANLVAFQPEDAVKPYVAAGGMGLVIKLRVGYGPLPDEPLTGTPAAQRDQLAARAAAKTAGPPQLNVQVFDPNVNTVLPSQLVSPTRPVVLPASAADGSGVVEVDVPVAATAKLAGYPFVFVGISPATFNHQLWVDDDPADPPVRVLAPVLDSSGNLSPTPVALTMADPADRARAGTLTFTGREGTYGQQVKGDPSGQGQTCVYRFRDLKVAGGGGGPVPIEMRVGIEKNGDQNGEDVPTDVRLSVTDPATGRTADVPALLHPENNRVLYASLPADLARSGSFDVGVRCLSAEQWVGLKPNSLSVVRSDTSFGFNLAKSLAVLWLLSVLVTTISVFCSTFLTWPTAVVLTIVVLFGRWGLNELGDAAQAGLGRQFVTEFGVSDPSIAVGLGDSVELLNRVFKAVAGVLPDISAFSATDDIDRGVSIPWHTLGSGAWVLLVFGLPLTVAAYMVLKNKEVAP